MMHTKLFTRRLALAAGLMLGWTSGAAADIRLSVDREKVREEAGRTEITVTAKNYASAAPSAPLADVANDTYVSLQSSTNGLNSRFRITQTTLVIPKGESQASETIIFTPIDDDLKGNDDHDEGPGTKTDTAGNDAANEDDDLLITIFGSAGATPVQPTTITLIDNDKASTAIHLAFSQTTLSKRAGATEIVVTAELDGAVMTSDVSFQLRIDENNSTAQRDADYFAQLGSITIRRRRASGTATLTITPNNQGVGQIELIGAPSPVAGLNVVPDQIDITDANLSIKSLTATPASVRENAGRTEITLTVTLDEAPVVDETVTLDIVAPRAGTPAVRDDDYRATLPPGKAITVAADETEGTATLTFTPLNNEEEDGDRSLGVKATASGGSTQMDIAILDDETLSDSIELSVNPDAISENAGETQVTITATLTGKVLDEDVSLIFLEDSAGTAIRDTDYTRPVARLTILAGQVQGSGTVTITPIDDGKEEADETIILRVASNPENEYGDPIAVGTATVTLKDTGEHVEEPPTGDTTPVFAGGAADLSATVGTAITPVVLPAATGDGTLTYSVSTLPAGLVFNAATRTLSGTPTAAGEQTIIYTVIDGDEVARESAAMIFTITVAPKSQRTVAVQSLTTSPSSIREDAGTTEITLTVTLAEAPVVDETVTLDFVSPSAGATAVIDTDYDASLRGIKTITIPAGETVWTGTIPSFAPINNDEADGDRSFGVQATASGGSAQTDITITDDETASTSIALSVNPHTISEQDDRTSIEVTAALKGEKLAENITVTVEIDAASTATRDLDYGALFDKEIVIPAGSITGSTLFIVQPRIDTLAEGDETIKLIGKINGVVEGEAEITLSDPAEGPSDSPGSSTVVAGGNYTYTVGTEITLLLPEQTRLVSGQPADLVFDEATRTLSGTPTEATDGPVTVTYVTNQDGKLGLEEFTITINPSSLDPPDSPGSSTVVAGGNYTYTVGTEITLLLPEQTVLVSGQPAGLVFDTATRTLSGAPTEATDGSVSVSYVVDQDGNIEFKEFTITINPSSSDSPDSPGSSLGFAEEIKDQEYTTGTAIDPLILPEATGGTPPLTYGISGQPAGLVFDEATRTLSGTPTEATDGAVIVTYTVIDQDKDIFSATFTITVNEEPDFGNLFDLFGSSKVVPTASHDLTAIREFVVGQRVAALVLPAASGGTAPLAYSLSPTLPAGLTFDPATRTIAGTPLAAGETAYTYTVTDANGASASLSLQTLPTAFALASNFPNPFNPTTTIQYALPQAADVELTVYNVLGQPVRTLVAEYQSAGRYAVEWDATDDRGHRLSSGMYFYRLQVGGQFREVKKMLLLK